MDKFYLWLDKKDLVDLFLFYGIMLLLSCDSVYTGVGAWLTLLRKRIGRFCLM